MDRKPDEIETETRITSLLIRIGDKSSSTSSLEVPTSTDLDLSTYRPR